VAYEPPKTTIKEYKGERGMNILGSIFSGVGGKIVDSLDGLFTSDEERLKAQNALQVILNQAEKDVRGAAQKHDEERTTRHAADMKSDSWLSKNVRPASLVFLLVVVSILAITDGNISLEGVCVGNPCTPERFKVGAEYITLFNDLLVLVFGFYFGSRGIEKVAKAITPILKSKRKKPKEDSWFDQDGD